MDFILFMLFGTLFTAAIWQILLSNDSHDENDSSGCIVSLVLGFICTLIIYVLRLVA